MRTEEGAGAHSFNEPEWEWPIDVDRYDRSPHLSPQESEHMGRLVARFTAGGKGWHKGARAALARLLHPLEDALDHIGAVIESAQAFSSKMHSRFHRRCTLIFMKVHTQGAVLRTHARVDSGI